MYNLKTPCKDCPFSKGSTMGASLHPDRVPSIIEDLLSDDHKVFTCHKTIDYAALDEWLDEDESDGAFKTQPGNEMCMGSLIYLQKVGRPHISQRMAYALGLLDYDEVQKQFENVIDEQEILNRK